MIPAELPMLAEGFHSRGSGKACIMNAISYLNGDRVITDMPSCTYPLLAQVALRVNDMICRHRDGMLLCRDCSHQMWLLGARLIGTASAVDGWTGHELHVLNVRLAVCAARQVLHLVREKDRAVCATAVDTAEAWCDGVTSGEQWRAAADATFATAATIAATYAAAAARVRVFHTIIDEFNRLTGYTENHTWTDHDYQLVTEQARLGSTP